MTPGVPPIAKIKNFKGWYDRGSSDDIPQDHFSQALNVVYPGNDANSREGLDIFFTLDHTVLAYFVYSSDVVPVTAGLGLYPMIYMDASGAIYDGGQAPNALLHTFTGATDFAALEAFGRIYISPKINGLGQPGEFIYYWDGTNFAPVAGVAPGSAPTLAQVNPGVVDAGDHNIAVSFLYRTGYLSPPSPVASIASTGTNDIELSAIPTGGSAVVGRVLLMSLSGQTELFFVPGGTINDNVTTTAVINIHDSSLIVSADYLYNIALAAGACSSIKFYKGRLVLIGNNFTPFNVIFSDQIILDSFNSVTGILAIPRDNALNAPNTGLVLSNVFYILKPYGTYATQDNGDSPGTWDLTTVDSALGSYDTSVSIFSSGLSGQDILDSSFIVHPRGVLLFTGSYSDPPLTWKIENFWQRFTDLHLSTQFAFVRVANDIVKKRLYIAFTDAFIVMDYSNGLTADAVRWSEWNFVSNTVIPRAITVAVDQDGDYKPLLSAGTTTVADPNLYTLDVNATTDLGSSPITTIMKFAPVFAEEGAVTTFSGLRMRVKGGGGLNFTLSDEDDLHSVNPPGFNLSSYGSTGQDLYRGINFTNEKIVVTIFSDTATLGFFSLRRLDIFGVSQWQVRASITQNT